MVWQKARARFHLLVYEMEHSTKILEYEFQDVFSLFSRVPNRFAHAYSVEKNIAVDLDSVLADHSSSFRTAGTTYVGIFTKTSSSCGLDLDEANIKIQALIFPNINENCSHIFIYIYIIGLDRFKCIALL
jgi:hypothetical protein